MPGTIRAEDVSSRCVQMIREHSGIVIEDLDLCVQDNQVTISGTIGSWHGKQLASESARRLFPDLRINNLLKVVTAR